MTKKNCRRINWTAVCTTEGFRRHKLHLNFGLMHLLLPEAELLSVTILTILTHVCMYPGLLKDIGRFMLSPWGTHLIQQKENLT